MSMPFVVVSVLAVWTVLTAIALTLDVIRHALEDVRRRLEPVASMVPLVETQTAPLALAAEEFIRQLTPAS